MGITRICSVVLIVVNIKMLGDRGLTESTEIAILNANYIKQRLEGHYDTLYSGEQGRAAHEMIIDCRDFKSNGIEVVDIARSGRSAA